MKGDAELSVRIYLPGAKNLVYTRESPVDVEPLKISEFQVLSSIKVKPEKKDMSSVKLTQADSNKAARLFDEKIDDVKERLGVKDEEDSEEQEDQEEEKKVAAPVQILTVKRTIAPKA